MEFNEWKYHDSEIDHMEYRDGNLILHICHSLDENCLSPFCVELKNEECGGFAIYLCRRYPKFHKVNFRGCEMSLATLSRHFLKGCRLQINNIFSEFGTDSIIFECELLPYPRGAGVANLVFIVVSDYESVCFKC